MTLPLQMKSDSWDGRSAGVFTPGAMVAWTATDLKRQTNTESS